jgi:hypothetical protein
MRRINGPRPDAEGYYYIPEEYEKENHKDVPKWKRKAIVASVPHLVSAGAHHDVVDIRRNLNSFVKSNQMTRKMVGSPTSKGRRGT